MNSPHVIDSRKYNERKLSQMGNSQLILLSDPKRGQLLSLPTAKYAQGDRNLKQVVLDSSRHKMND